MKKIFDKIGTTEVRHILAVIYLISIILYLYILAYKPVPENNRDLVNVLGGNVIGWGGLILSFFYGDKKQDKVDNQGK